MRYSKKNPVIRLSSVLTVLILMICLCIPAGAAGTDNTPVAASGTEEENLNIYYSAVERGSANPEEPLAITTYEGGGDQPTHPKVLYFLEGWNGHKYWMAYTPYPGNNGNEENPCVTYSDDGIHWSEEGISNPIDRTAYDTCIFSDVHLVYIPDTDTMELWARWCSTAGDDGKEPGWEGVYRWKSKDGLHWEDKEYLYHSIDTEFTSVLSPAVIYDEGKYKIWVCHQREFLRYYESDDGTDWKYIRDISVNITPLGEYKLWHFDMIRTDKGYEFVGCYQRNGEFDQNNYIAYSRSDDNIHFEPAVCILANGEKGSFDDLELYRPSLVKVGNKYRLYYGAQKDFMIWHIGMTEAPDMMLLHELLDANTEEELPTYGSGNDDADQGGIGFIKPALNKMWEHKKYIAVGFFAATMLFATCGCAVCVYYRRKR